MTSIKLKKSSVAGKVPVDSDLAHGELAINFQDGKLFYKDASNNIKAFIDSAAVGSLITAGQGLDSAGVKSVHFADNESLTFGNDSDLQIFHSGSNSIIKDNGTGALDLRGSVIRIRNTAGTKTGLQYNQGQAIQLFYDTSKKFETTDSGVAVTGQLTADSATVNNITVGAVSNGIKVTASGFGTNVLNMSNHNIVGVNLLQFNDPGAGEGLQFDNIKLFESPNDLSNAAGNLQVTYNNTRRFTVDDSGAEVIGHLNLPDNGRIKLGDSNDLQIYHDGSHSYIEEGGTGQLIVKTSQFLARNPSNVDMFNATSGGAANLYHAGSKKFETTATGAKISGGTGDAVLLLEADTTNTDEDDNARIEYSQDGGGVTASHGTDGNNRFFIQTTTGGGTTKFDMHGGAETRLYYASNIKLETLDSGVNITGNLRVNNAPFSSGIDSNAVTSLIDSAYVLSRGGASIEVLQDDSSLSHLQKLSFAPVIADGEVLLQPKISVLDSAGTESLLNINFAGGGGVDSAATIAIVNGVLTNADSATFNQISIPDGAALGATNRINVGNSDDLKIYHDGLNSHIAEGGTGDLNISGTNNIILKSSPTGEFYAIFRNNGAAELYHNNNKRIETTDSGATITGSITADSATINDGSIFFDSAGNSQRLQLSHTLRQQSDVLLVQTATGFIRIGSQNTQFAHFETDRPRFYFGQQIMTNGTITSYISDLQLQSKQVTKITLTDSGATVAGRLRADSATISGLKLPTADGSVNQAILTDGNGNLTFGTVALSSAGGVAGVFNQVAVNSFTGDSSNKNFTLAAAPVGGKNSVVITINGIVQHVNSYSLAGSTITLDSAPQTGDAIEMRTHDDYVANIQLRDYTSYVYTPSTNTTAFSGADANGNTLAYDQGKVQVYLNGAKLVTGSDYIETSGTTLTLDSAIGSGDTLEIVSLSKAAIADFGVLPVDSDLTTTAANQIIHEFNRSDFRTVKYLVQLEHDSDNKYHSEEILLTHNNTTVAMTTYAQILLDSNLGSFDADISGANVRLKLTPTKTNTSVKLRAIRVGA